MQAVSLPDVALQTRTTAFIDMVLGQITANVGADIELCKGSFPTIVNCSIADNTAAEFGLF